MNHYILITVILLLSINLYGFLYSYLIVKKKFYNSFKIQSKNIELKILLNRIPLVTFNVSILILLNIIGLYFFKDTFIKDFNSYPILVLEVFTVLFVDDFFFYFLHRFMHENRFIYRKIHKIHHRANVPMPIEYIYVHPLEWMSGMIGPFLGMILIGGISFESYLIYLVIRNMHEIHIHSGIKTSLIHKILPFYGTNEHHDMHHAYLNGNYASAFSFWDRMFKTVIKGDGKFHKL